MTPDPTTQQGRRERLRMHAAAALGLPRSSPWATINRVAAERAKTTEARAGADKVLASLDSRRRKPRETATTATSAARGSRHPVIAARDRRHVFGRPVPDTPAA